MNIINSLLFFSDFHKISYFLFFKKDKTYITLSLIFGLFLLSWTTQCDKTHSVEQLSRYFTTSYHYHSDSLVKVRVPEAKQYCQDNKWNTDVCFMVDMSIHSGKKRFFIWDLNNNKVLSSGLVSHGCGDNIWGMDNTKLNPVFSNVPESYCTSLGKYKIGNRGVSSWGIKVNYLLHGMNSTNSNALNRQIVLHSWEDISDEETFPAGTPEGWGCPAVSNRFMTKLDSILIASKKPVLMWVFKD